MIIIPARLESIRLPNKVLREINGKTLLSHVITSCKQVTDELVVVATDNEQIGDEALNSKADAVVMTKNTHLTGTDRVYEAAQILELDPNEIIINVQADNFLLDPNDINKLKTHSEIHEGAIITLVKTNYDGNKDNPNTVKVVMDKFNRAMYFSRAPIPYPREFEFYTEHVGIYAFQMRALKRFCESSHRQLEKLENIEHLRALENGMEIYGVNTEFNYISINTPEDIRRINND